MPSRPPAAPRTSPSPPPSLCLLSRSMVHKCAMRLTSWVPTSSPTSTLVSLRPVPVTSSSASSGFSPRSVLRSPRRAATTWSLAGRARVTRTALPSPASRSRRRPSPASSRSAASRASSSATRTICGRPRAPMASSRAGAALTYSRCFRLENKRRWSVMKGEGGGGELP